MKTVAIYHKTVPNSKNQEKIDLLKNYALGVSSVGDTVLNITDHQYRPSDVALIQGWLGEGSITSQHLQLRNTVIKNQINSKKYVICESIIVDFNACRDLTGDA